MIHSIAFFLFVFCSFCCVYIHTFVMKRAVYRAMLIQFHCLFNVSPFSFTKSNAECYSLRRLPFSLPSNFAYVQLYICQLCHSINFYAIEWVELRIGSFSHCFNATFIGSFFFFSISLVLFLFNRSSSMQYSLFGSSSNSFFLLRYVLAVYIRVCECVRASFVCIFCQKAKKKKTNNTT